MAYLEPPFEDEFNFDLDADFREFVPSGTKPSLLRKASSGENFDPLLDEAEKFLEEHRKKFSGALLDWNEARAEEFARTPVETLITDPYFLGMGDSIYPGVKQDILDLFRERTLRDVNLAIFLEGIGAGKTTKSSLIIWLLWFLELALRVNPQSHFSLAPNSVIAIANMNRCLTGDSLIRTSKGLIRLDSLFAPQSFSREEFEAPSDLLVSRNGGFSPVTRLWARGILKVYRITTLSGRSIKASENHRFFTFHDNQFKFRPLRNLRAGDPLVLSLKAPPETLPSPIPERLWYAIGFFLGDGYIGGKRRKISWCWEKKNEGAGVAAAHLHRVLSEVYGEESISIRDYPYKSTFRGNLIGTGLQSCRKVLDELGIADLGSEKHIPLIAYSLEEHLRAELLRGLFDTDGTATLNRPSVKFTSKSEELTKGVQTLLGTFGINSKVYHKTKKNCWTVVVQGLNAKKFHEKISFHHSSKAARLYETINSKSYRFKGDEYGTSLNEVIHSFYEYAKVYSPDLYRAVQTNIKTLGTLRELYEAYREIDHPTVQILKMVLDDSLFFDEVVSFEELGFEPTYDLEVDEAHHYIANDFVVHNSERQARKVTFSEVWNRFQSPFNRDYFPVSDRFTTEIRIPRNNTSIFPGTSSGLSILGYNLISSIIDEACFDSTLVKNLSFTTPLNSLEEKIDLLEVLEILNFPSGTKILSSDEEGNEVEVQVEGIIRQPDQLVFEIELEDGSILPLTETQLILTSSGWKKVSDLSLEDEILEISPRLI